MSTLTDSFDAALQIRESVIDQIFGGMHAAQVIQHRYVRAFGGKRVELQIAAPDITLITADQPDKLARATATARVIYHSRTLTNVGDPGTSAVAQIVLKAVISLSTGDPAPTANLALVLGWETTREDITVYAAGVAVQTEVKDAIFDFIQSIGGGQYSIPAAGGISSLAFRFLNATKGRVAVIGLNLNGVKGAKADLQQAFVQQDWALALGKDYVLGKIRSQMSQQLGALPPPLGPSPVTVSDRTVCTMPGPNGSCIDQGRQRVVLDSLDVVFKTGKIVFSGAVRQKTDKWYVPELSATFTAEATLSVAADQTISVSVTQPAVQLDQWYAQVFDFLSGDALTAIVRDGVADALASGVQPGSFSGLFSSANLQELAALGTAGLVAITPVANQVEVRSDGIIVHGSVAVPNATRAPTAAFAAIRGQAGALDRILHGGESWAPGNQIERADWDFGDGQTLSTSGTGTRTVVRHQYAAPGIYRVCLTVTDSLVRTVTTCRTLYAGMLTLDHIPKSGDSRWRVCDGPDNFTAEFLVTDNGLAVGGATVSPASPEGTSHVTGPDGRVTLPLNPVWFRPPEIPTAFVVRVLDVTASHAGYSLATNVMNLMDCAAMSRFNDFSDWVSAFRDRLVKFVPPDETVDPFGGDPLGPLIEETLVDMGLSLDILTKIIILMNRGSAILPVEQLLGIKPSDKAGREVIVRFDAIRKEVEFRFAESAKQLEAVARLVDEKGR